MQHGMNNRQRVDKNENNRAVRDSKEGRTKESGLLQFGLTELHEYRARDLQKFATLASWEYTS